MNIARLIVAGRAVSELVGDPNVITMTSDVITRRVQVHIRPEGMAEIAPLDRWTLNKSRNCGTYPFEHSFALDVLDFIAITRDPMCVEDYRPAEIETVPA